MIYPRLARFIGNQVYKATWAGAVARWVRDRLMDQMNLADFAGFAANDPTVDSGPALEAAIDAANDLGGAIVWLPAGDIYISDVVKTITDGISFRGVHKLATRIWPFAAGQADVLRFSGDFEISHMQVSGGTENGSPNDWADNGIVSENGIFDCHDMRVYRCGNNVVAERGNFARIRDTQVGFVREVGITLGGVDAGALDVVSFAWAANKLTIITDGDPKVRTGGLFYLYDCTTTALDGGPFTCVAGTDRDLNKVVMDLTPNPGAMVNVGTYTPQRRGGSAISESRLDTVDIFSGSAGQTLVDAIGFFWQADNGGELVITFGIDRDFEEGEGVTLRLFTPAAVNGTYVASAGTGGDTLIVPKAVDPGVVGYTLGQAYTKYTGTGLLLGTDCGATRTKNVQTGGFVYGARNYDNFGRTKLPSTGFGPYAGCAYLTLSGYNGGNCETASLHVGVNGSNITVSDKSKFSAPADAGIGIIVDSPIAWLDLNGAGFHNCGKYAMQVLDAYGGNVTGGTVRDIGINGGTAGNGFVFEDGGSNWAVGGVQFNPDMQVNTSTTMARGVWLKADAGGNAFTGTVDVFDGHFKDMTTGNAVNESGSGTLNYYDNAAIKILPASGAYKLTATLTANSGVTFPTTGTLATLAGVEELTNKTVTSPSIGGTVTGGATYNSPTLVTPALGVATATSINGLTITTSTGTLTVTNGNTLSFAEGTFTPTMAFATPGSSSFVYTDQIGHYQKVGAWVTVFIDLSVTPTIGTGSGDVRIAGLPFAAGLSFLSGTISGSDVDITWPAGSTSLVAATVTGQTYLVLRGMASATATANQQASGLTGGNVNTIRITIKYKV